MQLDRVAYLEWALDNSRGENPRSSPRAIHTDKPVSPSKPATLSPSTKRGVTRRHVASAGAAPAFPRSTLWNFELDDKLSEPLDEAAEGELVTPGKKKIFTSAARGVASLSKAMKLGAALSAGAASEAHGKPDPGEALRQYNLAKAALHLRPAHEAAAAAAAGDEPAPADDAPADAPLDADEQALAKAEREARELAAEAELVVSESSHALLLDALHRALGGGEVDTSSPPGSPARPRFAGRFHEAQACVVRRVAHQVAVEHPGVLVDEALALLPVRTPTPASGVATTDDDERLELLSAAERATTARDSPATLGVASPLEPPAHEDAIEHYQSSQIYGTFQAMHRPRVQSRPLTAGRGYLRECEAQQVAPLPMFDRLEYDRANPRLARLDLTKYGIGDKSAVALATFLRTAAGKLSLSELSVAHNAVKTRGLHALVRALGYHPELTRLDASGNALRQGPGLALAQLLAPPRRDGSGGVQRLALLLGGSCSGATRAAALHADEAADAAATRATSAPTADADDTSSLDEGASFVAEDSLDGGASLTDGATLATLGEPAIIARPLTALKELALSGCGLTDETIHAVVEALAFDVAPGGIARGGALATLRTIDLSRNSVSRSGHALARLVSAAPVLAALDLGWNNLRDTDALAVADALADARALETLNLAWNNFGDFEATQAIARAIGQNCSLTELDLSWNRVREPGCLCVANALIANTKLRVLCMDGNPVGQTGGAQLLEVVASTASAAADATDGDAAGPSVPRADAQPPMRVVSLEGCNFVSYQANDGPVPFNLRDPNGEYSLDLTNPYDRMVAKQLQTLAYTQGGECWRGEKIDGVAVDFPEISPVEWVVRIVEGWRAEQADDAAAAVARACDPAVLSRLRDLARQAIDQGVRLLSPPPSDDHEPWAQWVSRCDALLAGSMLDLWRWRLPPQLENDESGKYELAADGLPKGGVLQLYFVSNRPVEVSEITHNQFSQVLRTLQQQIDQADERHASQLVASVSEMYSFSASQAREVVTKFQSSSARVTAAVKLLMHVVDTSDSEGILAELNELERKQVEKALGQLYWFTPHSPSGNYRLNLAIATERLVAQRIIDINARERSERRAAMGADRAGGLGATATAAAKLSCSKGDFSEKANWESFRNEEYDGMPFTYVPGWQLPHHGVWAFDYVSLSRPPAHAEPLGEDAFDSLLKEHDAKSAAGIHTPSQIFLSAAQLGRLLSHFEQAAERIELFVIYFSRVTDDENLHVVLADMSEAERLALNHRLGPLALFNPFEPDGLYKLDLSRLDSRTMAIILVQLATHESGRVLSQQLYNGVEFQLPMSWMSTNSGGGGSGMPTKGVWEVKLEKFARCIFRALTWRFPSHTGTLCHPRRGYSQPKGAPRGCGTLSRLEVP